MQFQSILAILTFAIAASAEPVPTKPKPVNQCSQTQTTACCDKISPQLIGINCVAVSLVGGGQCRQNQQLACCNTGSQTGVINVGSVCPNIIVVG